MAVAATTHTGASRARSAARRRESASGQVRAARRTRTVCIRPRLLLACTVLLAGLFGYTGLHASLTCTGFGRSELAERCRIERIRNERLKIELERRTSPRAVVAAAEAMGMVYATEYDYIQPSRTVAQSGR